MNSFKRTLFIVTVLVSLIMLFGCNNSKVDNNNNKGVKTMNIIQDIYPDKSRYNPEDPVSIHVQLNNTEDTEITGDVLLDVYYLNQHIFSTGTTSPVTLKSGETKSLDLTLDLPESDFKGYIIEVKFQQDKKIVDALTTAVDVSSDWSKFPRYGYVVDYNQKSETEVETIIKNLSKYHINGIQFYDWQYKHQDPVPFDEEGNVKSQWLDIANRKVYANTVRLLIEKAHDQNMMAMNYNLIFGTYEDAEDDGVNLDWGLYVDQDGNQIDYHPLNSNWQTSKILLMNPKNKEWQNYIFEKERRTMEVFDFDGWHVDQLGDRGTRYTKDGQEVNVIDAYIDFLHAAKEKIDKKFVFNTVDTYGQHDVAAKAPVDFVYTEVWGSKTYYALQRIIKDAFKESNNEKAIILAAYMNYGKRDQQGFFNTPAILLMDAVVFASGGHRIELGDTGMLSSEYFPSNNIAMTADLKAKLRNYYSFSVAYQNFLRDNIEDIQSTVTISDEKGNVRVSRIGNRDTVWYFARQKGNLEFLHLINLLGNENDWRDDEMTKNEPTKLENIIVKYYTDKDVKQVSVASPDFELIKPFGLDFTASEDAEGKFITFELPSLEYWDMVIIENR